MADIYKQGNILDYTNATGSKINPGIIVQHPSGVNGIVLGDGIEFGETGSVQTDQLVAVANPDSVALSAGSTAGYDQVNDKVTAAAGGTFDIGAAVYGSSGTDDVVCRLN